MNESSTTTNITSRNRIDTEREFSLGLINDAFHLGYHCWWILAFVLSFGLFTIVLSFVAGVLDTRVVNQKPYDQLLKNLGEKDPDKAFATLERLSRTEGARRAENTSPVLLRDDLEKVRR